MFSTPNAEACHAEVSLLVENGLSQRNAIKSVSRKHGISLLEARGLFFRVHNSADAALAPLTAAMLDVVEDVQTLDGASYFVISEKNLAEILRTAYQIGRETGGN